MRNAFVMMMASAFIFGAIVQAQAKTAMPANGISVAQVDHAPTKTKGKMKHKKQGEKADAKAPNETTK